MQPGHLFGTLHIEHFILYSSEILTYMCKRNNFWKLRQSIFTYDSFEIFNIACAVSLFFPPL